MINSSHRHQVAKRSISKTRLFVSSVFLVLLTSCGGGGSENDNRIAVVVSDHHVAPLAVHHQTPSADAVPTEIKPLSPGDPKWGSQEKCTDDEIIKLTDGGHTNSALLSRHRHCSTIVSGPQELWVSVMKRTPESDYELYVPGVVNVEQRDEVYGTVDIEVDFVAFGPSSGLTKRHEVRARVKSFQANTTFPVPNSSNYSVEFTFGIMCEAMGLPAGTSAARCNTGSPMATGRLDLKPTSTTGWVSRDVTFDWAFAQNSDSSFLDYQVYQISIAQVAQYSVQATAKLDPNAPPPFTLGRDTGLLSMMRLRCDRGVPGGSPALGCVFPEASAVWVVDYARNPDVAQHILDAQTHPSAEQNSDAAPGLYVADENFRAVGGTGHGAANTPLQRSTSETTTKSNRARACGSSMASLISIRQFVATPSCPSPRSAGCNCDEYPMASTQQGADARTDATSVRYVTSTQNSSTGGLYGAFTARERVFGSAGLTDDFWVAVR